MSSGGLNQTKHPELFLWSDALDPAEFLRVRYAVASTYPGEATAIGMAMEQSAGTVEIPGYVSAPMMREWSARICSIRDLGSAEPSPVSAYMLATESYASPSAQTRRFEIVMAYPLRLFAGQASQWLNRMLGELPRLGFLLEFQLLDFEFPPEFGPGPQFGVAGIRERLGVARGPLLARATRPPTGLPDEPLFRISRDVLAAGFHLVKDDELMLFRDRGHFRRHLINMLAARDAARDSSGESKAYMATLLCDPEELQPRLDIAVSLGVDAALIAPFAQGLGSLTHLARQAALPLLAHNTVGDLMTRHPCWGIGDRACGQLLRAAGADWMVMPARLQPGGSDPALRACRDPQAGLRDSLPILQGGKQPAELGQYRSEVGSDDFMLIVASWVDRHPDGLAAGARAFREAIDSLQ